MYNSNYVWTNIIYHNLNLSTRRIQASLFHVSQKFEDLPCNVYLWKFYVCDDTGITGVMCLILFILWTLDNAFLSISFIFSFAFFSANSKI